MHEFKNGLGYFNEDLPTKKWNGVICIDRKAMVGMGLSGIYDNFIFENVNILEYISDNNAQFKVKYSDKESIVQCGHFLNGNLGGILDIDLNNKYIDKNNVIHIHITTTKGDKYEALYSGEHIEYVIKSNWYVNLRKNGDVHCVQSSNYNGTQIRLHQVDLGSWVDHINNNPLDNRIENLRKTNQQHNSKNKKYKSSTEIIGLRKSKNGWYCSYSINRITISTKLKQTIEEATIDGLIAQRYIGYMHNEELFYLLDGLPHERIDEVETLIENKLIKIKTKIHNKKVYVHTIISENGYYKLICNGKEMLFDCDLKLIENKRLNNSKGYWICEFVDGGIINKNQFHKELLNLRPNEYNEYNIHIDHLNGNSNDNRYDNLAITTAYSNQCNKQGLGYGQIKVSGYQVRYMNRYRFWDLIGGTNKPFFKFEIEAIAEVERRKSIIDNARVKLKSREELDELIQYCLDNNYKKINNQGKEIADLDLGYLYWKGIYKLIKGEDYEP